MISRLGLIAGAEYSRRSSFRSSDRHESQRWKCCCLWGMEILLQTYLTFINVRLLAWVIIIRVETVLIWERWSCLLAPRDGASLGGAWHAANRSLAFSRCGGSTFIWEVFGGWVGTRRRGTRGWHCGNNGWNLDRVQVHPCRLGSVSVRSGNQSDERPLQGYNQWMTQTLRWVHFCSRTGHGMRNARGGRLRRWGPSAWPSPSDI